MRCFCDLVNERTLKGAPEVEMLSQTHMEVKSSQDKSPQGAKGGFL